MHVFSMDCYTLVLRATQTFFVARHLRIDAQYTAFHSDITTMSSREPGAGRVMRV
jgi:hypothetical protein